MGSLPGGQVNNKENKIMTTTPKNKLFTLPVATLEQHINDTYGTDDQSDKAKTKAKSLFTKNHKLHSNQAGRWLDKHCLWIRGNVFIPKADMPNAVTNDEYAAYLTEYIKHKCDGNESAFSSDNLVTQQQVNRWTHATCVIYKGKLYRKQTDFKTK